MIVFIGRCFIIAEVGALRPRTALTGISVADEHEDAGHHEEQERSPRIAEVLRPSTTNIR